VRWQELSPGVWNPTGSLSIWFVLPSRPELLPSEIHREPALVVGAILEQMAAQVGTVNGFANASLSLVDPEAEGPVSLRPTRTTTELRIEWGIQ